LTPSYLKLITVLSGVLLLSLNLGLKQTPSSRELEMASESIRQPVRWLGKVAPPIRVPLRGGGEFDLAEHVGRKVVVLNFFATWCGPCRQEMPELNRFVARHAGKPVLLVGIDANESPELVDAFVKDLGIAFPVGIDSSRELQKKLGVESFPTTVVVGVDGRIALYETSAILNAEVTFDALVKTNLEELAAGRGVGPETWTQLAKEEKYRDVLTPAKKSSDEVALTGRAAAIAGKMKCICGCAHLLNECNCSTATAMKKKLAEGDFGEKTDLQIAEALNSEFCMKGM
jgi:thiol-disulfide isomerase/thioredoxin